MGFLFLLHSAILKCSCGDYELCLWKYLWQEAFRKRRPPPRPIWGAWNSLTRRETVYPKTFLDISWKSVHAFSRYISNRQTKRHTNNNKKANRWKHNIHRWAKITPYPLRCILWRQTSHESFCDIFIDLHTGFSPLSKTALVYCYLDLFKLNSVIKIL